MPKSGVWPGGGGLERTAGSRDGSVGVASGEDDGLEHLSAEEKACLLFLEETIKSLDSEEDGRSADESERISMARNVANELNGLLASRGRLRDSEKVAVKGGAFPKPPLVAPEASAIGPHRSRSAAGPGVPSDKGLRPQPLAANGSAPPAPPEVNARHPPPTTPRDVFVKTSGGPLPRGPLSYDALVHLRKSGSTKKTPLCPTVDHTIDGGGELPAAAGGLETRSGGPRPQAKRPPAVAPKPKAALPKPPAKPERDEAAPEDCPRGLTHAMDPEVVRLEALRKLGLLREAEAGGEALGPLPPPKPPSFLNPKPSRGPDRSPPSCSSERQSNQQNHANGERRPAGRPSADPGSAEAPPGACDASGAVGYTVMVLPGMGADRKEALRKLGLLKNDSR